MAKSGHSRLVSIALFAAMAVPPAAGAPAQAAIRCRIHDAQEILASLVVASGNPNPQAAPAENLRFTDASGHTWDLITRIDDPAILNRGSGAFHPAQGAEVQRAFDSLSASLLGEIDVDVYLLPYPRRGLIASNAEKGVIYLSPGVYSYSAAQLHALVVHELGHVWQLRYFPDSQVESWSFYARLRGFDDPALYNGTAAHRNRPHEIFAEDFRVLFGGELANYSQSIENTDLTYPTQVPGLVSFISNLPTYQASVADNFSLVSSPNPFNPLTTIRFTLPDGQHNVTLAIVDAGGRLVRRLAEEELTAGQYEYRWDGRDGDGRPAASGVYFARLVSGNRRSNHKLILAR